LGDVLGDGGASIGEADLEEHFSSRLRAVRGWDTPEAFRKELSREAPTVTGVRADGDDAIIGLLTPAALRLERVVRVDSDGLIDLLTLRLAGGASMAMVAAAAWRAAHAAHDDPVVLDDTFAGLLVGDALPHHVDAVRDRTHGTDGFHHRWNVAARGRLAEETLAAKKSEGVDQYVVLGAGLDSFALRNDDPNLTIYEIDTLQSQSWKLDRLAQVGIAAPANVHHVVCDFEEQDFVTCLTDVGFEIRDPAVASWLGVSTYLSAEAIRSTLERVAGWPRGSAIVFDYLIAESRWDDVEGYDSDRIRTVREGVAAAGEPFMTMFEDDELEDLCRSCGFGEVELLGQKDIISRFMDGRTSMVPGPDPVMKLACAHVR
jgi:methyltransferase (TIGR00027 family)